MKIGVVVDGTAESQALRNITRRLDIQSTIIDPVFANMQPKATPAQIARAAKGVIEALLNRGATRVIVLIDREDRNECPGEWAGQLEEAFKAIVGAGRVVVVVKNRAFENWMIADVTALRRARARFGVTETFARTVSPDKADGVLNAANALSGICKGKGYHKRRDAISICAALDPLKAAANSRSLRRFLRVLGHPTYNNQSAKPAE